MNLSPRSRQIVEEVIRSKLHTRATAGELMDTIEELYANIRDTPNRPTDLTLDPLIRALFDRLPPLGTEWPLKDRARWLAAMDGVLNLIYPADLGEGIIIRVQECPDIGEGQRCP